MLPLFLSIYLERYTTHCSYVHIAAIRIPKVDSTHVNSVCDIIIAHVIIGMHRPTDRRRRNHKVDQLAAQFMHGRLVKLSISICMQVSCK